MLPCDMTAVVKIYVSRDCAIFSMNCRFSSSLAAIEAGEALYTMPRCCMRNCGPHACRHLWVEPLAAGLVAVTVADARSALDNCDGYSAS